MKHKTLLCIVLVVIIGISVFSMVHIINADTQPVVRVVLSGTASNSSIQPVNVGQSFSVDVRVDNTGSISPGINGASFAVTWNPAVLNCTNAADGKAFWGSKATYIDLSPDNTNGIAVFNQIILDTSNPTAVSAQTTGVLAALTFQVLSVGQSNINLQPSDVGVAYLTYPTVGPTGGISNDILTSTVNAIYGATSPTPAPTATPTPTPTPSPTPTPNPSVHGPKAIISTQNGTIYGVGAPILLDGSSSTLGYDNQTCSITNYGWLVQYQNNTLFGAYSGQAVSIVVPNPTYLLVTLSVTAPDLTIPPSAAYTNTSATSIWIKVEPAQQLTSIDLFTDKGGLGPNATSPGFIPGELVQLYAYVTDKGAAVANPEQVLFTVFDPNGTIISITSAPTNSTGYAYQEYRTPWFDNGTTDFGIWTVLASVEISQVVVSDTASFMYNYPVIITQNGITIPAAVARGSNMNIQVTFQNIDNSTNWMFLAITIYDNESVPINAILINANTISGNTASANVIIPPWAFVGTATVYVNILSQSPAAGGVPVCPEQSAVFKILP